MKKPKNILLLSSKATVGIINQIRESEIRDWNLVTREDLESIEKQYYSKTSKDDDISESIIAEKNRLLEKYEREDAGVDRYGNRLSNKKRRAVTNYTKPKKRRKKK